MSAVERLALLITADGQGAIREFNKVGSAAERDLGKAESKIDRVGSRMTSAGAVMMGASAVMVAGLWNAGQSASQLEQAVGGSEAVFKDSAGALKTWAEGAAQSVGLSESAALSLTTRLGGALKGLGFEQQEAADQAVKLTEVAADLAATYGGTTAEAVQALGSAFRGEFDPAEQFNLFLKQSTVDAKAVEMGLAKTTTEVDANARAQATLALVMEQSTDAQGQFGRELDSTAGQLAVSSAEFENAKAQIGEGFLPVMSKVAGIAGTAASGIASADDATGGLISETLAWTSVGLGAAGATAFLAGKMIELRNSAAAVKLGQLALAHPVAAVGIAAVAGGLALGSMAERLGEMAYEGKYAVGTVEELSEVLISLGRNGESSAEIENLIEAFQTTGDTVSDTGKKISGLVGLVPIIGSVGSALVSWGDAKGGANAADEAIRQFEESIKAIAASDGAPAATNAVDQIELALIAGGMSAEDAAGKVAGARQAIGSAVAPTLSLAEAQQDAANATNNHAGAAKTVNDAMKALFDPLFGATKAVEANRDAMDAAADASLGVFFAQQAHTQAVKDHGATSVEALDAEKALTEAVEKADDANWAVATSAMEVDMSLRTLQAGVEDGTIKWDEAKATLDRWVAQGLITRDQADEVARSLYGVGMMALAVPKSVATTVTVIGEGEARAAFQRIIDAARAAGQATYLASPGVVSKGGMPNFYVPGSAGGGGLQEGWNVTSENGPELVWKQGSTVDVYPNTKPVSGRAPVAAMAGGGGETIHVVLQVDGRTIAEVTKPYLRTTDRGVK